MNHSGAVAGLSTTSAGDAHAFLFTGAMLDLGTLGGRFSEPWDLNGAGQVVGQSSTAGDLAQRAFLFSNGSMQDLGTLGGSASLAVGINNSGQVTGSAYVPGDQWHAFLWANGVMQDLGTLGGTYSAAIDINDAGQVVGQSLQTNDFVMRAFLYTGGAMVDLGTLGGTESVATAINASGMVIGDSHTEDFENHAFLYANGQMHDIGTLGGSYSTANGLNDLGQVIGEAFTTDNESSRGFLYHNGVMTDLGSLGGGVSAAWGINNGGQIVGYTVNSMGQMVGFLWENGVMVDLNTFLPPDSGWELLAGRFINDAGQIVGFGFLEGRFAQFLLTPQESSNRAPNANAGPDAMVECSNAVVLDAGASSDPDGDALTYEWSENGVVLGTGVRLEQSFSLGVHNVHLSVTDSHGASASDDVVVTVVDGTAPTVTCLAAVELAANENCQAVMPDFRSRVLATDNCTASLDLVRTQAPEAGRPVGVGSHAVSVTVTDASGNSSSCVVTLVVVDRTPPVIACPEAVRLSPRVNCQAMLPDFVSTLMASDNCDGELVGSQTPPAGTLVSGGTHVVALVVTDAAGNRAECSVNVTVVDREAPVFTAISATPNVLLPNKHMVPVTVSVQVRDNCDPSPISRLVSISSSDPVTGPGDNTAPDFRITGPLTAEVRAERLKTGRVYTLTVECRDVSGNVSMQSVRVSVPKGKDEPVAAEQKGNAKKVGVVKVSSRPAKKAK